MGALKRLGHNIVVADRFNTDFGRAQVILKTQGGYIGGSEWRTDGHYEAMEEASNAFLGAANELYERIMDFVEANRADFREPA